ncbi:MAG TPA: hypothetical protein VGW38_08345 [Chloroflexota bacterium]|nr:hypothetical protein [Chloroflexota bacterium]
MSSSAESSPPATATSAAESPTEWEGRVLKANTGQFVGSPTIRVREAEEEEWSGVGFWFRWVFATTFGLVIAGATAGALSSIFGDFEHPTVEISEYAGSFLVILLQWLVLRPRLPRTYMWIVVSLVGILIGGAIFQGLDAAVGQIMGGWSTALEGAVQLLLEGLVLAIAQWLWLRRYVQKASRWILANLFWITLFMPIFFFGGGDGDPADLPGPAAAAIVSGLVVAVVGLVSSAITGAEMVWLLRHRKERVASNE